MSKAANSNKAADIMDVTPDEVENSLRQHTVRQMIHGHTHRPARHEHTAGTRWVLGDWHSQGWVIEATEENLELYNFNIIQ